MWDYVRQLILYDGRFCSFFVINVYAYYNIHYPNGKHNIVRVLVYIRAAILCCKKIAPYNSLNNNFNKKNVYTII